MEPPHSRATRPAPPFRTRITELYGIRLPLAAIVIRLEEEARVALGRLERLQPADEASMTYLEAIASDSRRGQG